VERFSTDQNGAADDPTTLARTSGRLHVSVADIAFTRS